MPWNDTRPWLKDPATRFKTPLDPAILARQHDAHCHPSDDEHFQADTLREVKTGHLVSDPVKRERSCLRFDPD